MKTRAATATEKQTKLAVKKSLAVDNTGKGPGGISHDLEDIVVRALYSNPTIKV